MQYVYLGSMVEERDECLEGTPNWRIARFGWDVFVEGRDFCFGGTRNWRIARFRWVCLWKDGTFVLGGRGIGA